MSRENLHRKESCAYEKLIKKAAAIKQINTDKIKSICLKLYRVSPLCRCDTKSTKMMHSIFRRDRRRHLDKVVDCLFGFTSTNDYNNRETSFDKLRERLLKELLSLQMISKYHE